MFNKIEQYVQQPDYKHKLLIYSDGNDDYTTVLSEYYNADCLCYGQKVKSLNLKRKIYGNPKIDDINTNINESVNTQLRNHCSRLVRKSQCHAKSKYALSNSVALFQFYWNFMKIIREKLSPAMIEKQATKVWTWGNFLHAKLSYT
jgi:hypothetical protein